MIQTSLFALFSNYMGEASLSGILDNIGSGVYRPMVGKIRLALERGDKKAAEGLKKSLPAFTLSATYDKVRKEPYIKTYNPLVILDVDHVGATELERIARLAHEVPYTVAYFVSPSGDGMKIIVYAAVKGDPSPANHKRVYEAVRRRYADLLHVEFDTSGSDVGRLCFVSDDPRLYLSPKYLPWLEGKGEVPEGLANLPLPPPGLPAAKDSARPAQARDPKDDDEGKPKTKPLELARKRAMRKGKYEDGNRNNFVFLMASHANRLGVEQEEMKAYADHSFADLAPDERTQAIESAYTHTDQHGADVKTPGKKLYRVDVEAIEQYIKLRYISRKNVVRGVVEVRGRNKSKAPFERITDYWENSLWRNLQKEGILCNLTDLRAILCSDFSPAYNPFNHYFERLPAWDGERDWIGELADTVVTTRPRFWRECLRKWLIAVVACAIEKGKDNHSVLLLSGAQGIGKTTWLRHLVPPELADYTFSGNIDPANKDCMLMLSDCLIIIVDELSGQSRPELNRFKAMITMDSVYQRRAYGRYAEVYDRHASLAATVNDSQVLTDRTGSRRFLCFEALSIDYRTPVQHAGIYAQALALLRGGEKYWFSDEEIDEINNNNEPFQLNSPEEELFYTYFRKPERFEPTQYLTTSDIVAKIAQNARLNVSSVNVNNLGRMLKRQGFEQMKKNHRRVFSVFEYSFDQVKANFSRQADLVNDDDHDEPEKTDANENTSDQQVDKNPTLPF